MKLSNKIALVTGASRGIGAGIARELAANGARVILAARTLHPDPQQTWGEGGPPIPGSLAENVARIEAAGGKAEAYPIDLSNTAEIEKMIAEIDARHGRIDILVNCAMGFPQSYKGQVWDTADRDWHAFMDIGVRAKYLTTHFASKIMMRERQGLIANISAGASKIEYYNPVFRMAMSAIDRMTAAVADDLKPHNVHAVSIWPRWVRTERVLMAAENEQLGFEVSREDLDESDTPEFTGRAIVQLALDPELSSRSGQTFPLLQLAHDYGFGDLDGSVTELDEFSSDWADRLARISRILREEPG